MKLKVFTQTNCRYCPQVVNYLKDKGVEFEKINLTINPEENKYDLMSTPAIVLLDENDDVIVTYAGTNLNEIDIIISQL